MRSLTPAKVSMIMFLVVGGLIVAYVAKGLLAKPETKPVATTRNVPMAIADLPVGTMIREEHLGMGPVNIASLRPDMLLQNRVIVGRVVKTPIKHATPIMAGQLYEPGNNAPLTTPAGKRTLTLAVKEATNLVDGLIKTGEFVDVLFTPNEMTGDPRVRGGLTVRLMKGIKVVAINRLTQPGPIDNDRNTVTVEVSPDQANALNLAKEKGTINLVHTPDGEGNGKLALAEMTDQNRATLEEILGLAPVKPPEAPPAPKAPFISQIYRTTGRQEMRFAPNGEILENFGGWWMSPYYLQSQAYMNFYQQNPQLLPQMMNQPNGMQQQQQQQQQQPQQQNGKAASNTPPMNTPGYGRQPLRQPAPINTWGNTASLQNDKSA